MVLSYLLTECLYTLHCRIEIILFNKNFIPKSDLQEKSPITQVKLSNQNPLLHCSVVPKNSPFRPHLYVQKTLSA